MTIRNQIQNQLTAVDRAWLKRNRAKVHEFGEDHGDEIWVMFQIVRGGKSISGHPFGTLREAMRAAIDAARKETKP